MKPETRRALLFGSLGAAALAAAWIPFAETGNGPDSAGGPRGAAAIEPAARPAADSGTPAEAPAPPSGAEREVAQPRAAELRSVQIRGRTVDERRFPIAGAAVVLVSDGATLGGGAATGADGRFELATTLADGASLRGVLLRAAAADGRVALETLRDLLGSEIDVGTLVLAAGAVLRVRAVAGEAPVPGARIAVELPPYRAATAAVALADAAGTAAFAHLPAGVAYLVASAPGAAGVRQVLLPDEGDVAVELRPTRVFEVAVVDAADGAPVAGARLCVRELLALPAGDDPKDTMIGEVNLWRPVPLLETASDAAGRARLAGLPAGARLGLEVSHDGYAAIPGPPPHSPVMLKDSAGVVTVELRRLQFRTVRFPVAAGEVPAPAAGTVVQLRGAARSRYGRDAGPSAGAMGQGEVVVEGLDGSGAFLAVAPDGSLARLWVKEGATAGAPTSFMKPRAIDVRVRNADGHPAPGARVSALDQGNNEVGAIVATDADGRARIEGLYPQLVSLWVAPPGARGIGSERASVDLETGDGALEITLERQATFRMRVRIDGEPRLPADFRVGSGRLSSRVLEEVPERGELRVGLDIGSEQEGEELRVFIRGRDSLAGSALVVPVLGGADPVVEIDLESPGRLWVDVRRPAGTPVELALEQWDGEAGAFARAFIPGAGQSMSVPNGVGNEFRIGGLKAGRYRAVETRSGTVSAAADVVAGAEPAHLVLALQAPQYVRGRVEVPAGTALDAVRVLVEGGAAPRRSPMAWLDGGAPPEGAFVDGSGKFEVPIPGDRPVVVRAWHPWLQPAAEGGSLATTDGRDGVVLRLAPGQELRLPAPALAAIPHLEGVRVAAWRTGSSGGERWLRGVLENGVIRCGGLEPGQWSLWVDPQRVFAPLALGDVEVPAGVLELPAAVFPSGASLRVRILAGAGAAAPRIYVSAESEGDPRYFRDVNSSGEAEVIVRGLGRDRFRVRAGRIGGGGRQLEESVECDGVADVVVTLDLR